MSTPPLRLNPSKSSQSSSKPITSLSNDSEQPTKSSTSSLSSGSSLRPPKSSVSKKKPPGLDISRSIPTRAAPPNPGASPANGTPASSRSNYHSKLSEQLAGLELADSKREKLDLRTEDLKVVGELGAGNGGTVTKVVHAGTGLTMAKKLVLIDAKPSVRKQILRELQIMHECSSPYIVSFYGAFLADPHICICMECMDRGSLDGIYRKHGAVDIAIVGKIAEAVLEGLIYLYDAHRIIHRDIKPSNILANSNGEIKICDFGVSGELVNSIANTFVGTSTYMSPERIQGANYTIKSDVWSLGISLIELALGRFPFSDAPDDDDDLEDPDPTLPLSTQRPQAEKRKSKGVSLGGGGMTMSILDLLQHIVNEPAPRLTAGRYPVEAEDFVAGCLDKDPETRFAPKLLLASPWITESKITQADLKAWAQTLG